MPIIRSAKKKLRKDRRLTAHNKQIKDVLKGLVKAARHDASKKNLQAVYSTLDKAAKTHLIHRNKAARLKSRLTKVSTPKA